MAAIPKALLNKLTPDEVRLLTPGLKYDRGKPESSKLPDPRVLKKSDTAQLLEVMMRFNLAGTWQSIVTYNMQYAARLATIPPGPGIQMALDGILDTMSGRGLLGMTRRVWESSNTLEAIEGDVSHELIWVSQDDQNSCSACLEAEGQIMSYMDWQLRGGPGEGTCLGGSMCRCTLVRVD
jgi:hypothetical protein